MVNPISYGYSQACLFLRGTTSEIKKNGNVGLQLGMYLSEFYYTTNFIGNIGFDGSFGGIGEIAFALDGLVRTVRLGINIFESYFENGMDYIHVLPGVVGNSRETISGLIEIVQNIHSKK